MNTQDSPTVTEAPKPKPGPRAPQLLTKSYVRNPFYVDAVQCSDANLELVAAWCGGTVETAPAFSNKPEQDFVKVDVRNPLTERQTRAFPGDWVLKAGEQFKVYTPKAFVNNFTLTSDV